MTTRRRSRATDEMPADTRALAAQVAELVADRARQAAVIDGLAVRLIEVAEDIAEVRGLLRAQGKLPPAGLVALKEAVALTGATYETSRRWCARGIVRAERTGLRWCVSVASLSAALAKRRCTAA